MKKTLSYRLKLGVAPLALGVAALSQPAIAQDAGAVSQAEQDEIASGSEETIIVTGSRIARPELTSAVPVAVVDNAELQANASQNISDTLNEMPQVGIGSTRANTNFLTSGTGVATVNLRGIGASRTLVLVNGRRFIGGFAGDSAVDINNIPTDFVERVDVVTGGSSAVYGSDAIAGVVNFILKDKFEGIQVRAQTSLTERGDNPRYMASVTAGTTFGADDRGNVLLNFTWDKDGGLRSNKRARSAQDCFGLICGPAAYSSYPAQGRFQLVGFDDEGELGGQSVYNGSSLFTFNPDNSVVSGFPTGYGFNRNNERYISVPVERYLVSGLANYDLTDSIELYAEGSYGRVTSNSRMEPTPLDWEDVYNRDGDLGISIDNPFIPASVRDAILAANSDADTGNDVSAIQFRRRQNDVFNRSNTVRRDTWRAVVGARGDLTDKFKFDVSYVYGYLNDYNASEDIDNQRYRQALNAVRVGTGNELGVDIVCADAAAREAGCVPINLFGYGTVDPRAAAYVQAVVPKSEEITNQQHVISASISGSPFALWAGDVGVAVGAEYRKEKTKDDLDILTNTGGNSGNLVPDLVGKFDVWEVFGEVNVPLIRDSFINYAGLIGAVRYSDYSTIGSVFSWNAGAEIEPFDGLRLRGVYAVANRAPNVSELYSSPSETFASVDDPCNGTTATNDISGYGAACRAIPGVAAAIAADGVFEYTLAELQGINGYVGGNINLHEEKAKTLTLGAVYTPSFARGLIFTVDYYDIKLDDAINTLGREYSIQQCLKTQSPVFCDNVIRNDNTGKVTQVDGQLINVASRRVRGVDVGARYAQGLGLAEADRLSFSLNYTYTIDNKTQTDPSSPVEEYANTFGAAYSRHRFVTRIGYEVDGFGISWQTKFMSGGKFDKDFTNANPDIVALNKIKDYWLNDAQLKFAPNENFDLFLNIDNVFDKKPQFLPGTPFGTPTGLETSDEFDLYGRSFTVGIRAKI